MPGNLKLEVFDTETSVPSASVVMGSADLEEARLIAYETGYKAGWDDAVASKADEEARIRGEIGRNLQTLSFTYHEARAHVLRALEPLLTGTVARILPEIARQSLPHHVAAHLLPLAESAADAPVVLRVHPTTRAEVERLLSPDPGLPLSIADEPTLGEGQAWLQLGEAGVRIDLDAALAAIGAALADFYQLAAKEPDHG